MLLKLIKYEFKSIARIILPIYAICLIGLFAQILSQGTSIWGFLLLSISIVAVSVSIVILTITRFNKSLLGDEGYLMFTVPAPTYKIVLAKAITILIFYLIITLFMLLLFLTIISTEGRGINIGELILDLKEQNLYDRAIKIIIGGSFASVIGVLSTTLCVYFSLAVAQIGRLKKYKILVATAVFVGYGILQSKIFGLLMKISGNMVFIEPSSLGYQTPNSIINALNTSLFTANVIGVFEIVIFLSLTVYILNRHLNLD